MGRTPHGVRGLKSLTSGMLIMPFASHPARGAWIEIWSTTTSDPIEDSRTPHGVRGLKSLGLMANSGIKAVAPRTGCVD